MEVSGEKVMQRISQRMELFHNAERRVAELILHQPEKVLTSKVSELAELCGTSEATVIRFAKKAGYSGYSQLKLSLAAEIGEDNGRLKQILDTDNKAANTILLQTINNLKKLVSTVDYNIINECADLIQKARCLCFAANGNSVPIALDASFRFNSIGIWSVAHTLPDYTMTMISNLGKQDVIFAVSSTGSSIHVIKSVEHGKRRGCKVISLTTNPDSPLAELADVSVVAPVRVSNYSDVFWSSKICENIIVDIIMYTVFLRSELHSQHSYERIEELMSYNKILE